MQNRHVAGTLGELSRARVAEVGRLAQAWYERYLR
jgi:hypothetical protein